MNKFFLNLAKVRQNPQNRVFSDTVEVTSADEFRSRMPL